MTGHERMRVVYWASRSPASALPQQADREDRGLHLRLPAASHASGSEAKANPQDRRSEVNRWSNYSKRSVRRWHRLPTVEVRAYGLSAGVGVPVRRFTGLTFAQADRRANRWLASMM